MTILFLHGWRSVPGGVKPTYFKEHGHEVITPALNDNDFAAAVATALESYDQHLLPAAAQRHNHPNARKSHPPAFQHPLFTRFAIPVVYQDGVCLLDSANVLIYHPVVDIIDTHFPYTSVLHIN